MKTIKLLVIKNKIDFSIAPDIEKLKQWFLSIGLEPDFTFQDSDLPLYFKPVVQDYWGLDGMKQQLREELLVPALKFHIVYFCYQDPKTQAGLANFTYPNDLNGAAYCEIVYGGKEVVGLNGDVLIHETIHAFQRLLMWRGTYFVDILDTFKTAEGNKIVVNLYKLFFDKMLAEYPVQKKIFILTDFVNFLKSVVEKRKQSNLLALIERTAIGQGIHPNSEIFKNGLATLKCESGLNPKARNVNVDGTIDRGIAQFNNYWWKEITDEQADNPEYILPVFWKNFKKRPQDWSCYKFGKYQRYL